MLNGVDVKKEEGEVKAGGGCDSVGCGLKIAGEVQEF